jgi:hypothetical protein
MPKLPNGRDRRLNPQEEAQVLATVLEPVRSLVVLAFETGMRRGELCRIEPEKRYSCYLLKSVRTALSAWNRNTSM